MDIHMLCTHNSAEPTLHYKLTSTSGLRIRHFSHVRNLGQSFLTTDLGSTFPAFSFLLDLSPFDVGFVQLLLKTTIVFAIWIVTAGVLKRLRIAEGVLVGSSSNLSCGLLMI